MPSNVTDTREPSKPRMRRLPPDVPYGSLLVKLTPGIWLMLWKIVWPPGCVARYSLVRLMRDFGAVWSPERPIERTFVAVTTTSSIASVPVDWAKACWEAAAASKVATATEILWKRSNMAPFSLRIGISGFVPAAIYAALQVLWSTR